MEEYINKYTKEVIDRTNAGNDVWDYVVNKIFCFGCVQFKKHSSEIDFINCDTVLTTAKGRKSDRGFQWLHGTKWNKVDWKYFVDYAFNTETGKAEFEKHINTRKEYLTAKFKGNKTEWEVLKPLLPLYIETFKKIIDKDFERYGKKISVIEHVLRDILIFDESFEKVWVKTEDTIDLFGGSGSQRVFLDMAIQHFKDEFKEFDTEYNKTLDKFHEDTGKYLYVTDCFSRKLIEWLLQQKEAKDFISKVKSENKKVRDLEKQIKEIKDNLPFLQKNQDRLEEERIHDSIVAPRKELLRSVEPVDLDNYDGHKGALGLDPSIPEINVEEKII